MSWAEFEMTLEESESNTTGALSCSSHNGWCIPSLHLGLPYTAEAV